MQVFYNFLREFCRSWHAFDKCTPKPQTPMHRHSGFTQKRLLHTCSNQAKTEWEARGLGDTYPSVFR